MSDQMRPIPFSTLMTRILTEYKQNNTILGIHSLYHHQGSKTLPIFGETIETPFGPAAGPHTQLSQNLIAAYVGGSRFFELKTVQTLDGENLHVDKPCILALEEGYNVEWSTELTVPQAMDEYIKGWFALKLLSRELCLGSDMGFVFNMSVGYDLQGIRSEKIDRFIEGLKDARATDCFKKCMAWSLANLDRFSHVDEAFVRGINPHICRSITLSTLHGCPPDEIERIATYLIEQKHLHTYIKCNPTLLGYQFARETMDAMGYDELVFDDHHFKDDLQFVDAVPMFKRLLDKAATQKLEFGLKLSNTFPVTIAKNELPGEEMYMSGKSLFPLTVALAKKIETVFDGKLRVSYSGGADALNIESIFDCGIWPITLATTLLKPGGYNRLKPIAEALAAHTFKSFDGVAIDKLTALCEFAIHAPHHIKPLKVLPSRKLAMHVPLVDCFVAPCEEGCPIHQDITSYLDLVEAGKYEDALRVICEKNPLPFITGTICPHRCQTNCTRQFYEDSVHIRDAKLIAAAHGFDAFLPTLHTDEKRTQHLAIIGGGPAGMAAAFFAARAGASVTLFEKRGHLGGIVRHVIPAFRIAEEAIDCDAKMLEKLGVDIKLNHTIFSADELFAQGYTHVLLAVGAWEPSPLRLEHGKAMDVLDFLQAAKRQPETLPTCKHAVIVGGGNTAMDAARAAKRIGGVETATLVYRRTQREMPADLEELTLAIADGVHFCELRNPIALENGMLTLDMMALGQKDASGRRSPISTDKTEVIPCDLLIAAIGTQVDSAFLTANGVLVSERGRVFTLAQSDKLYVIGDALHGPATVVEAIADAQAAVTAILGETPATDVYTTTIDAISTTGACDPSHASILKSKHGLLCDCTTPTTEAARCLHCGEICENCVDVCPNRANIVLKVSGMVNEQILHLDGMCNECGNCVAFCPYDSAPYKDKLTLFESKEDFENSTNSGFLPLGEERVLVRLGGKTYETDLTQSADAQQPALMLIRAALQSNLFAK